MDMVVRRARIASSYLQSIDATWSVKEEIVGSHTLTYVTTLVEPSKAFRSRRMESDGITVARFSADVIRRKTKMSTHPSIEMCVAIPIETYIIVS
jgi:hypothetical protein